MRVGLNYFLCRSVSYVVYGTQYRHMEVKNKCADHLMAAIRKNETDPTQEQWVHDFIQHSVEVVEWDPARQRNVRRLVPTRVTPTQYAELLRKDEHWGQSDDLNIVVRVYGMNFVLINGREHTLYPFAKPNMPSVHMVSADSYQTLLSLHNV
jgi:hypothetical protein